MSEIENLDKARDLAVSNLDVYPQVLRSIYPIAANNNVAIQRWCALFFADSFGKTSPLARNIKLDVGLDALDALAALATVADAAIFVNVTHTVTALYDILFVYVAENPNASSTWIKLTAIRDALLARWNTPFPFAPQNDELDRYRGANAKFPLIKLMVKVVLLHTASLDKPPPPRDPRLRNRTPPKPSSHFGFSEVAPNHPLITRASEADGLRILDLMLAPFKQETINSGVLTAIINALPYLLRHRAHLGTQVFLVLEKFQSYAKLQSNYESVNTFKLLRRFVDRTLKVFLNHCFRNQLIPAELEPKLTTMANVLQTRADEQRRHNPLEAASTDDQIRKRPLSGFFNSAKVAASNSYRDMWLLGDPKDENHLFDVSSIPPDTLIKMVLIGLNKAEPKKLTQALEIVAARYANAVSVQMKTEMTPAAESDDEYDPEATYTLPAPKVLTFEQKKQQLQVIIAKYFETAGNATASQKLHATSESLNGVSNELNKTAIQDWSNDSWLTILSRLNTRGITSPGNNDEENQILSDMIRQAIFDYFTQSISTRVDVVVQWLHEEWYSERVTNEAVLAAELTSAGLTDEQVKARVKDADIPTPTYVTWCSKILDAVITYIEPSDRKIFIRLLGDVPYLNEDLVAKLASLCLDPVRSSIGIQALHFLILYRPPVKAWCLQVLEGLRESEDLKVKVTEMLEKFWPEKYGETSGIASESGPKVETEAQTSLMVGKTDFKAETSSKAEVVSTETQVDAPIQVKEEDVVMEEPSPVFEAGTETPEADDTTEQN
ncbi:hypothetical protein BABINDRAFT_163156 [Babjeviella inositovora NRRL Y-12698]|uniref:Symplekin/Pta1 N-terminal domain-containing protein n=1 Tax=Babjeviella inositovora NRRL Y-12698 TaxID=984486 RepID=A0A1E3QL89_9ASCO|nr:uncharacterized protein BABINDRAFT_163156 [Babjeviella inositovora NRRL Y-12698]ODQ77757.1 hypothetical protein BABINDRAFT_163156 [Babjeviella inositovora NRRL Y-12698]